MKELVCEWLCVLNVCLSVWGGTDIEKVRSPEVGVRLRFFDTEMYIARREGRHVYLKRVDGFRHMGMWDEVEVHVWYAERLLEHRR